MTELYLIAHKVRGEPAFDIACKIMIGDEEGWIIPTSGHGAHPYWHFLLADLFAYTNVGPPPADLPDHYAANSILKRQSDYTDRPPKAAIPNLEDI